MDVVNTKLTDPLANTRSGISSAAPCTGTPSPDYAALVDLYNSTNGPNWNRKSDWLNGCSPCGWSDITCNGSGRVIKVLLTDNQLNGTIPTSLSALTSLQTLALDNNQLSGTIPASLSALTNLQFLVLSFNQLEGTIPDALTKMTNLITLNLVTNRLNGPIPSSLSKLPNLQYLLLSRNQFRGPIPDSLSRLTKLINLSLDYNRLSGSIPASLSNLTNLRILYLNNNQLSGCFPASLSVFCNLYNAARAYFNFNPGLPDGGDFYSFCEEGIGRCPAANTAPVATTNVNQTATVGNPFSYTVNAFTDVETPASLTYSAAISPTNGLSFDPITRILSGTPTSTGVSSITISAIDSGELSATTSFTLTVDGTDLTPSLQLPLANFTASGSDATRNFTLLVAEVMGVSTAGRALITITVPLGYSLTFDNSLTSTTVSGTTNPVSVNNQNWSVSASSSLQMTLILNEGEPIRANSQSVVGFSLMRIGASVGTANITANVNDDASRSYDSNPANNIYVRNINALQ